MFRINVRRIFNKSTATQWVELYVLLYIGIGVVQNINKVYSRVQCRNNYLYMHKCISYDMYMYIYLYTV